MNVIEEKRFLKQMRNRPHLFILGAGATKATIPNGDKFGRKSPVMENFLEEIGLEKLLNGIELDTSSHNIEAIYSELYTKSKYANVVEAIEKGIVEHYKRLQLPETPTLYDYLILSLRDKDCIATFNWDPLLIQAYNRINKITRNLPQMLFLHSCVEAGFCEWCNYHVPLTRQICPQCGRKLKMPRLLFPVANKNYSQNLFIKNSWSEFERYLESASVLTIWGYSAPDSDVDAKQMMLKAFSANFRKLDQIEVIDIADENVIYDTWRPFIKETNYHIKIHKSFMESLAAEFPRRSVEGYVKRYFEKWWNGSTIELKECNTFDELSVLVEPLLINEKNDNYDVL